MKQEILRFENVTCKKDGAVYLDNFSFYMTAGEIVGLLSVNDRGIKELIELMAKNHPIDAGRVYMGGKLVNSYLNQEETSNRIYQIDQKSSLINDLSITDNLFVMRPGFKKQVINEWVLREQADRVLKQLSMDLDLNKRVERLTTMERIMVEIAKAEGADAICHGCTGKGNDQVRFELTLKALCPDMAIIAPWREWDIESRDEEIDYAEAHNIPLKINRETNYSKDKNLWHLSHEGLDLENPANEPQYNKPGFLELGVSPEQAPDTPTYLTLHFEKGIPTAVDGKEMGAVELVEYLNKVGGENGIGLLDIVENRLVGMKSRGVYETPGGAILYKAINVLETITLDKESAHFKAQMAQKYADIVYNGQWFTPLREALDAFADSLEKTVTGDVKLKLYKGNMINAGVTSPYTLYDEQTASFGEDEDYNQADATGFINLFGLSIKERAKLSKNWPEVK